MPSTKPLPANNHLQPIGVEQQAAVVAETEQRIHAATTLFDKEFAIIPVSFDLTGRAAGMYKVVGARRRIRYNPYIFALYFEEHLISTVAHEVAHYISDCLYGLSNIKPHGPQWRAVVKKFGTDASRTFDHSLEGVPQRQHRRVVYHCDCGEHQLGIRRHNKVCRQEAEYKCRRCRVVLKLSAVDEN
ncbi:MAG: metallopeptidase [Gammaproteobacteria bacterium]|nr:MAG: metallopeptidase [Gammaproteobacteria bacterium]